MCRLVRDDRKATVTQITTRYNQGMQNTISEHTTPEYCCCSCPSLYDYSVPIFWCYFQQDNAPCHKDQIISDWFVEHDNEFTLLKWPPVTRSQSNRAALGCGGTGDSHHGCAADKSATAAWCYHVNMDQNLWGMFPTPSLKKIILQHLFKHDYVRFPTYTIAFWVLLSMPRRIKAVLKAKGGPTRYWHGVSNKVASECIHIYCR